MNNTCTRARVVLFFILLFATTGCAARVPNALSDSQMQAITHNQRGIKYAARGDNQQARGEFSEALRISHSIENSDGIAVALINSSRMYRHDNDADAALTAISEALLHAPPQSPLYPEVAFEMAQVKLLSGNSGEATDWAYKAVAADSGPTRGIRMNLLARILLLTGKAAEAEQKVSEALLLNKNSGLRAEEANSLRTLGHLKAVTNRSVEAAASYNQALEIDKMIGKSSKIVADLRALAHLAQSQKNNGQAVEFYSRAYAASSADGDLSGAGEDLLNMSRIYEAQGDTDMVERLLRERSKILKNSSSPQ